MRELKFTYTNHRSEWGVRRICPISVRFGRSDYYPHEQWLMLGLDLDKMERREFAMAKMRLVDKTTLDITEPSSQGGTL